MTNRCDACAVHVEPYEVRCALCCAATRTPQDPVETVLMRRLVELLREPWQMRRASAVTNLAARLNAHLDTLDTLDHVGRMPR